jgi:hypothetical protein
MVEVNVSPVQVKPVGAEDLLAVLRSSGQLHLLRQMNPTLTRLVMPHLTTSELEAFGLAVIDAEARELPAGRADPDPRSQESRFL